MYISISNQQYVVKEFKKSHKSILNINKFDQLLICGDLSLPHIDWTSDSPTTNDHIHNYFTKTVKDNYLRQLVNFLFRLDTPDLVLTNFPDKVNNMQGFDDILNTDHKLILA
jgi:hypothetical protein